MAKVIIGQQLKKLRGEEFQADLVARLQATGVEALRISQQRYSDWEGGSRPPYEALVALARFWDVELLWLLTGEGEKKRRPEGDAEKILAEIRRLLDEPRSLSDDPDAKKAEIAAVEALPPRPPRRRVGGDGE